MIKPSIVLLLCTACLSEPNCKLLGILVNEIDTGEIPLNPNPTICNDNATTTGSCCNSTLEQGIRKAWLSAKIQLEERFLNTTNYIKNISQSMNMENLRKYLMKPSTTTANGRILEDIQIENVRLQSEIDHFDRILQAQQQNNYQIEIQEAEKSVQAAIDDNFLDVKLEEMVKNERSLCWEYYYNSIQRGIMCSFCVKESDKLISLTNHRINFTYSTCDYFIPLCLNMMVIQTRLNKLFKDIIILIIRKVIKGSEQTQTIKEFLKKVVIEDTANVVSECKKKAKCDTLCDDTFKFGQLTNDLITGSYYLLERVFRITIELAKQTNVTESIYVTRNTDRIKANFLKDSILNDTMYPEDRKNIELKFDSTVYKTKDEICTLPTKTTGITIGLTNEIATNKE